MRILLVNDYATPTAGAERITLDLRDGLRARGHEVRVLASRAQLIAGESFADATCYGTNTRLQTFTSTVNPSAARALRRMLREFAPDVVQVQMFLWQLSPSILPLLHDVPSVYWAMTFKSVCPTGLKWLPSGVPCAVRAGTVCLANGCITLSGFGPLMLQRALWRRRRGAFDTVVSCSHAVRRQLEADGIESHDVIWPGVREGRRRPPLDGPPTVTYAGRLTAEKGPDVLVRAFALARERVPLARLSIAGAGPTEPALRALVRDLGIADAVALHGQLGGEALDSMLDRGWVHAVPSRWPEPFGLTATEAMMRGTAVVASDIGGLAESVLHETTGLRVPAGDELALADALTRVLADRDLAERLGEAGRARAQERFSLNGCLTRFERLYESLRSPTASPPHAN
ncbi:MAG TPA: glycosyltransferase family 4 protein [Gemmatimonadaceae bacterium]|nr:glycosyltransferase family 4 protein [Gemmatimonadaceae bacterium]